MRTLESLTCRFATYRDLLLGMTRNDAEGRKQAEHGVNAIVLQVEVTRCDISFLLMRYASLFLHSTC
jgi:hypothetical protein